MTGVLQESRCPWASIPEKGPRHRGITNCCGLFKHKISKYILEWLDRRIVFQRYTSWRCGQNQRSAGNGNLQWNSYTRSQKLVCLSISLKCWEKVEHLSIFDSGCRCLLTMFRNFLMWESAHVCDFIQAFVFFLLLAGSVRTDGNTAGT